MPRRDRTGPMGRGPRTGWGLGPCGYGRASSRRRFPGRGYGFRGRPGGRFFGPDFWGRYDELEDKDWLRQQRDFLREELAALEEYLED